MQFVLANRHLLAAGGTEVHLVTIGEHLLRLGHAVMLYAPQIGPFADHVRQRGLDVCDNVRELPKACDVVFAQDTIAAYQLASFYPDALNIFRVCGDVSDFQLPPQTSGVVDLTVVLSDRYERAARACAVVTPLLRLRVPIDIDRLVAMGPLRKRPRKAVLLGNYLERDEVVIDAWSRHGMEVRRVGGHVQSYDVAKEVADADIVVAKARAALDAMACGRAVYVYDVFGGDGWVTPSLYPALEADNFAGQATGRVIDAAALEADLADYRAEMGTVNRDLILQHHSARDHVIALLDAIKQIAPQERPVAPFQELARLIALRSAWEVTAREFRSMHWPLRQHAAESEQRSLKAAEVTREALAERDKATAYARRLEAQLAELSRPVGATELDPLSGPKRYFLHDERALAGWHGLERHALFGEYRWSKQAATVKLPFAFDRAVDLSLRLLHAVSPERLQSLRLRANGAVVAHTTERQTDGSHVLKALAEPAKSDGIAAFELTIEASARRPVDIGLGDDARLLGVAVAWIDVEPAPRSLPPATA
jgi:hypothetical protein